MDERRQHVLVVIRLFMVIKHVIIVILAFQRIFMYKQNIEMMLIVVLFLKEVELISKDTMELREGRSTRKPKSFELIFIEYVNVCM